MLTSKDLIHNECIRNSFSLISRNSATDAAIISELVKARATDVIVRYRVGPKEYWKKRKMYTDNLDKNLKNNVVYLFSDGENAYICKKC